MQCKKAIGFFWQILSVLRCITLFALTLVCLNISIQFLHILFSIHFLVVVLSRTIMALLYSAVAGLKLLGGPTTSAKVTKF